MEQIYVFGLNWRRLSSARIEAYTIPSDQQLERLPGLSAVLGLGELCYLATCNRVELSCVLREGQHPERIREAIFAELTGEDDPVRARQEIRIWGGEGAVEHLFLVAAGLDSAQLGEQEVAGQLRRAIERAREAGTLGPQLLWIFEQVLKVAKRVQTESGLAAGRLSLAEIAVDAVRSSLLAKPGRVALVGVSKMTERCAESLQGQPAELLFVNRTVHRAEELATRFGGRALCLDAFRTSPPPLRALVSATGSSELLFGEHELRSLASRATQEHGLRPMLIDLGVPPDICPSAAASLGLPRIDMDQINARAAATSRRRSDQNAVARSLVDAALDRLREKLSGRNLSPLIGEIYSTFRDTAHRDLERVLSRRLPELDAAQRVELERFAQDLAKRLAHLPALGLRALAAESGFGPVRTFCTASSDPSTRRLRDLASGRMAEEFKL